MHKTVQNLLNIKTQIKTKIVELKYNYTPEIIAVSKTFLMDHIKPLIESGHNHFVAYENFPENKEFISELKRTGAKLFKITPRRNLESKISNKLIRKFLNPFSIRKKPTIAIRVAFKTLEPWSSTPCGRRSLNEATSSTPAANGVPSLIRYCAHTVL